MPKTTTKKTRKTPKIKKVSLDDCDHPLRRTAIDIIKTVVEPLLQRGINGAQYYNLENNLVKTMNKRLKSFIPNITKPDLKPSKTLENDENEDEDEIFNPFNDYDDDYDEDDDW